MIVWYLLLESLLCVFLMLLGVFILHYFQKSFLLHESSLVTGTDADIFGARN